MFSTKGTSNQIYVRTNNGSASNDTAVDPGAFGLGALIGAPHLYRIDWYTNSVDFSIDGILVHSQPVTIASDRISAWANPSRRRQA